MGAKQAGTGPGTEMPVCRYRTRGRGFIDRAAREGQLRQPGGPPATGAPRSWGAWLIGAWLCLAPFRADVANAAPPTLTKPAGESMPGTVQVGHARIFRLIYSDPDDDRPRSVTLVAEKPSGTSRIPAELPRTGNFQSGVPIEWKVSFDEAGTYRIHFEAESVAGRPGVAEARWPPEPTETITFTVVNPVTQWIMMGVGVLVSLLVLPMFVFFILRGMSRRVDPGATARFALLIGILAAATWYGYLFWNVYGIPSVIVVGVVALGAAFVLATMRR
jgi:hypothetical protein